MLNFSIDEEKTLSILKESVDLLKKHTNQLTEVKEKIDNELFNINILSEKYPEFAGKIKEILKDIREITRDHKLASKELDTKLHYLQISNVNFEAEHARKDLNEKT